MRVVALSLLVGENLWVIITRAGAGLLDRLLELLQLPVAPDLLLVQLMALALVLIQQLVYVLALHALAYWIFPRLQAPVPEPPPLLHHDGGSAPPLRGRQKGPVCGAAGPDLENHPPVCERRLLEERLAADTYQTP